MAFARNCSSFVLLAVAGVLCLSVVGPALGDDLTPPPWDRLGAANYTTSAEWEFFGPIVAPGTTQIADGTDVPLIIGDGTGGMPPDMLPDFDIAWVPYDGDGGYLGGANGIGDGTMNFRVGNWIDTEDLKVLRIQIVYDRGTTAASPYVDQITAYDPLGISSITQTSVTDGPIVGDPAGRFHRLEVWEIEPNPDFESVLVVVPDGVLVDQVVIDTISTSNIPEPSALAMLGWCGLLIARRRRRG